MRRMIVAMMIVVGMAVGCNTETGAPTRNVCDPCDTEKTTVVVLAGWVQDEQDTGDATHVDNADELLRLALADLEECLEEGEDQPR